MFKWPNILLGLGLVPGGHRSVEPIPSTLKELVPQPVDNNITIKPSVPDTEKDTMPLIVEKAKRTAYQTKKLTKALKGATLASTLKNFSDFVLKYIAYKKDDAAHEQIRSPRRLIYDAAGDCDCFSVFLATLLINAGIKFRFRIAKYKAGDWSHIYIVVPKDQRNEKPLNARSEYYVLDPVANAHDHEVEFLEKRDYTMALQFLDGYDNSNYGFLNGLGCGVDNNGGNGGNNNITVNVDNAPKVSYMVSVKALEQQGWTQAKPFLDQLGLPYKEYSDGDGVPYFEVATPSGTQKVSAIIPIDPQGQKVIEDRLLAAPVKTLTASAQDIAPTVGKVALGMLAFVAIASMIRSAGNKKASPGLGALPRKRIPVVQL